jgi:hypothetical protein
LSQVDFGLAIISPDANQTELMGMKWTALKASSGAIDFMGIPDLTIAGDTITVEINQVSGAKGTS